MTEETIPIGDPRHEAAEAVIRAMHAYWNVDPGGGAVRWIEDTSGRLIVFTRGEYKHRIREAIGENPKPEQAFEYRELEIEGFPLDEEE